MSVSMPRNDCVVERRVGPPVNLSCVLFPSVPLPFIRRFSQQPAMKLLLSKEPGGKGANDGILMKRLRECRLILKSRSCDSSSGGRNRAST